MAGVGHVKLPQLRNLLGDLPIDGYLHQRGYYDFRVHRGGMTILAFISEAVRIGVTGGRSSL